MNLDLGEVDLTSHIHVPALSNHVYRPMDLQLHKTCSRCVFRYCEDFWKAHVSWFLDSVDVMWATSFLVWLDLNLWMNRRCGVRQLTREYRGLSRTKSHEGR